MPHDDKLWRAGFVECPHGVCIPPSNVWRWRGHGFPQRCMYPVEHTVLGRGKTASPPAPTGTPAFTISFGKT
jgi:hypothetical protein